MEEAVALIAERAAKTGKGKSSRSKAKPAKKAAGSKTKTATAKKKPAAKKAAKKTTA
jgi:DNA topoisomerase-1